LEQAEKTRQELLEPAQADGHPAQTAERAAWSKTRISYFERQEAWLREMADADGVIRYLEETPVLEAMWQDRVRKHIDEAIELVRQREADAPLSDADWNRLLAAFQDYTFTRWRNDSARDRAGKPVLSFQEGTRNCRLNAPQMMHQILADMYLDPSKRALIPESVLAAYEPHWRRLESNRPHRMGGYHDGVQSDAVIGPAKNLLLFQIASDDAMHWCWGDAGAYYFWIRPKHLAANDFSGVEMWLECH
jgi:hypothetical protein